MPRRYKGGPAIAKLAADKHLLQIAEEIWLTLEELGIVPDFGRWQRRGRR